MSAHSKTLSANGRRDGLASELRALRNRSGLTLAALAQRTNYSKSSWERYLNGKSLPPEAAVRAFAEAVGAHPGRLLVLRGVAEREEESEAGARLPSVVPDSAQAGGSAGEPASGDRRRTGRRRTLLLGGLFTALGLVVGIAVGLGVAALVPDDAVSPARAGAGHTRPSAGSGPSADSGPRCVGFECDGKDAERYGCDEKVWTAAQRRAGTTYVELRYSPTCQAAWGRIVHADVGDVVVVEGPEGHTAKRPLSYGHDVYTPMVDAPYPASARACVELTDGDAVCTERGGASPAPYTTPRPSGS